MVIALGAAVRSLRAEAVVQERANAARTSANRGLRKGFGMEERERRAARRGEDGAALACS